MTIKEILKITGPLLSGELARRLEEYNSIPSNTASQKVSRDKTIEKIKGFFISQQSLCYLPEQINDGVLFEALDKALFHSGKKYWYCLNAIKLHGGIISGRYLQCYTSYPILPLKSHKPFNIVMQNFVKEGILVFIDETYMFSPKFSKTETNNISFRTIEIIKDNVIEDFNRLCKNIGLISYSTGENFSEYGKFRWCFKGVSTISGLMRQKDNGFLLADILIGKSFYEKDILFFIQKLKHIQSFENAPRLIPVIIVDNLDKQALILLKKHGIVVGFIGELFGQKYAETLNELVSILNNAGASLKQTPDRYITLIKELKKYNEGLANNIKGTLFEFVVGHIHSKSSNSSIDLGRKIFENSSWHDIDVFSKYPQKIVFSECKAYKSKINIQTIDDWLQVKIPALKKWIDRQETLNNKAIEFEFWSISGFDDDAMKKLMHISNTAKRYKVSFFEGKDIKQKAIELKDKNLKEILNDFFLNKQV